MTNERIKDFTNNPKEMGKIFNTMQGYDNVVVQGGDKYKAVIKAAAGDLPYKEIPGVVVLGINVVLSQGTTEQQQANPWLRAVSQDCLMWHAICSRVQKVLALINRL